jgi:hypothetical protein
MTYKIGKDILKNKTNYMRENINVDTSDAIIIRGDVDSLKKILRLEGYVIRKATKTELANAIGIEPEEVRMYESMFGQTYIAFKGKRVVLFREKGPDED